MYVTVCVCVCVCLFTNFIQFCVWLKMVERPPHDHFAGKMMKNNLLELGVYMFKHAHVGLDTSSVRWSVGICWHWMLTPVQQDLRCGLDRAGPNIRPPNNIQPQNDPRSARSHTTEKKKNNAKPVARGICLNRPTIPHLSVRESRYLDAFYICYLWS